MHQPPLPLRLSTSTARDHLSAIITRVQDPRAFCILTRHGKAVAAVVSMDELHRIIDARDIEDVIAGKRRPASFTFGFGLGAETNREAAEKIRQIQMTRRTEREVLAQAGLDPVPGGEMVGEIEVEEAKKVGWWRRVWGS